MVASASCSFSRFCFEARMNVVPIIEYAGCRDIWLGCVLTGIDGLHCFCSYWVQCQLGLQTISSLAGSSEVQFS